MRETVRRDGKILYSMIRQAIVSRRGNVPSSAALRDTREDEAELLELLDAVGEGNAGNTRSRLDRDDDEWKLLVDELALRDNIGTSEQ